MSPNADMAFTVPDAVTSVRTTPDPTRDETLSADQLQAKYDPAAKDGVWAEHPMYRMEEWRDEVGGRKTILGYWAWVVAQFEVKEEGHESKAEKRADAEKKEVEQLEAEDPGNQGS